MLVSVLDIDEHDITRLQRGGDITQIDMAVDFRRIGLRPSSRTDAAIFIHVADFVDDNWNATPHLCRKLSGADSGCFRHDTLESLFLDLFRHWVGQIVRLRAVHRFKAERANTV